mmetsp:Transcript_41175/g.87170  ORF Transcript_41175/g.87170 Transcript_41175/m.87170 type:complete len:315 (-) Transcript_41175:1363-2307(-)
MVVVRVGRHQGHVGLAARRVVGALCVQEHPVSPRVHVKSLAVGEAVAEIPGHGGVQAEGVGGGAVVAAEMPVAEAQVPDTLVGRALLEALVGGQGLKHTVHREVDSGDIQVVLPAEVPIKIHVVSLSVANNLRQIPAKHILAVVVGVVDVVVQGPVEIPCLNAASVGRYCDLCRGLGHPAGPLAVDDGDAVSGDPREAVGGEGRGVGVGHLEGPSRVHPRVQHVVHPQTHTPGHRQDPRVLVEIRGVGARRPLQLPEVQVLLVGRDLPGKAITNRGVGVGGVPDQVAGVAVLLDVDADAGEGGEGAQGHAVLGL